MSSNAWYEVRPRPAISTATRDCPDVDARIVWNTSAPCLRDSRVRGAVLAYRPPLETMSLIGTDEVHAPHQRRLVAGSAHGVGPRGNGGAERVVVHPDAVCRGPPQRHEQHATGHTHRCCTASRVQAHALVGEVVDVWRAHQIVAVTPQVMTAVLIGDENEDVRSVQSEGLSVSWTVNLRRLMNHD